MGQIIIATCIKRQEIKMAAAGVEASGRELLLVEEDNGNCTVFGTDPSGNAVDLRSVAKLAVASADPAIVVAELPAGLPKDAQNMTFVLYGVSPSVPESPVIVSIDLSPAKDSAFKAVHLDLPCVAIYNAAVPRSVAPPTVVVTPGKPVIAGVDKPVVKK